MYTEEKDCISFLFRTLLLEEFRSKRAMARKLDIPLRTLQENSQHLDCAKRRNGGFCTTGIKVKT